MRTFTAALAYFIATSFMTISAHAQVCEHDQLYQATIMNNIGSLTQQTQNCELRPNEKGPLERTLLFSAVEFDAVQAAEWLIERGARADLEDSQGMTPLHLLHSTEMASVLLKASPFLNKVDQYGRTPFHTALDSENWELLDRMRAAGAAIKAEDLMWAARYYRYEVLEYLADRASPKELKGTGEFFWHFFFYEGDWQDLALKYVAKGADLNKARAPGNGEGLLASYIHDYISSGQEFAKHGLKAIRFLVEQGADVAAEDGLTSEPLFQWVLNKKDYATASAVLSLFLSHGMDINQQSKTTGKTALMKLAGMVPTSEKDQVFFERMTTELLTNDASVDLQSSDGRTALHWAVHSGNESVALRLAPVTRHDLRDTKGQTAVEYAKERLGTSLPIEERRALVRIIRALQ